MNEAIQFLRDYCPAAPVGLVDYFEDSFVEVDIGAGYHVTPERIYIGIAENDIAQLIHEMGHFLEMEDISRLLEPNFGLGSKRRRTMNKRSKMAREMRVDTIAKELCESWGLTFSQGMYKIHVFYDVQSNLDLLAEWKRRNEFLRSHYAGKLLFTAR